MDAIKARVQAVIPNGKYGPYAIASSDQLEGTIIFFLNGNVWKEKLRPKKGQAVCLGKLKDRNPGWRAKEARFWQPSDEQNKQTERRDAMQMLYPFIRQYPFDQTCEDIVRALEAQNWDVPGIKVRFDEYGAGYEKYCMVQEIKGENFRLYFSRPQCTLPGRGWRDMAAINKIVIPRKEICVYADVSCSEFYLYVGDDWAQDREAFMKSSKVSSKYYKRPRMYLSYRGGCLCKAADETPIDEIPHLIARVSRDDKKIAKLPHWHSNFLSPLFIHTNDHGREYDPKARWRWRGLKIWREPAEPRALQTAEVMAEFDRYLRNVVLKMIVSPSLVTA